MKEEIKIAFFGASGTGKTTLAKLVSEKYNIPYLEKISSDIFDEIIENKKDPLSDKKNNGLFLLSNCICRMHEQLCTNNYVADRSVMDSYLYVCLDFDFSYKQRILDFLIYNFINNPYDLLVFVPKEFELCESDVKPRLDICHRNKENELANRLYEEFKESGIARNFIKVSGSINERMEQIEKVLSLKKNDYESKKYRR